MNVRLCLVHVFLLNMYADFDETFHMACACIEEGFKIGGMSKVPTRLPTIL